MQHKHNQTEIILLNLANLTFVSSTDRLLQGDWVYTGVLWGVMLCMYVIVFV